MEEENISCNTEESLETKTSATQELAAEEAKGETQRENECKDLSIQYSFPTPTSECAAETALAEENQREDECLTYSQKQDLLLNHLFADMILAEYDNILKYDMSIQVRSDVSTQISPYKENPVLQLSVLVTESQMDNDNMLKMSTEAFVTVSDDFVSVRRNVFSCSSLVGKPAGSPVLYGDEILIRLVDADGPILYLSGVLPHNFGDADMKLAVVLTDMPDLFDKFCIVDPDPEITKRLLGTPVPTFARVAIAQTVTNLLLAVDLTETFVTSFSIDHPVQCCTHRNTEGRVTSEHFWKFVTQVIDQGTGDAENTDVSSIEETSDLSDTDSESSNTQ